MNFVQFKFDHVAFCTLSSRRKGGARKREKTSSGIPIHPAECPVGRRSLTYPPHSAARSRSPEEDDKGIDRMGTISAQEQTHCGGSRADWAHAKRRSRAKRRTQRRGWTEN